MSRPNRRWAVWLLPFLVARLLVPAGFMLSASGAGFGVALCPGYAPLPVSIADASGHAGMHHGDHAPESTGPSACPFLLAGSAAGCPPIELVHEPDGSSDVLPACRTLAQWDSQAVLIDRIRGPPSA